MTAQIKRSKGSVRYAFKDSNIELEKNKKKQSLIYLYFNYGDKRLKYSVGFKSCYAHWDFKKQRIKNISSLIDKDEINQKLNYFQDTLLERYGKLYEDFGDSVDNVMVKNELDIIVRKKGVVMDSKASSLTLTEICNKYLADKGSSIAAVTSRAYSQAITQLIGYEAKNKITLTCEMIDLSFCNSFKEYLEDEDFRLRTIKKHFKTIKTFMNYAYSEGYTKSLKFKNNGFKLGNEVATEIYLSEKEIKEMHNIDLSKDPVLEHVRDVFLIGCYTGQRISDYNSLSKDDIVTVDNVQYFKFVQRKNRKQGKIVMCPITNEIRDIMDKRYNGFPPPPIKDQYINEHIKDVGFKLKFTELIKREYTKGGKLITEMIPKYKMIMSHTARRSFCTNMYLKEMPVYDIMLFSGHTTEKEFYKYIRVKDEERAQHIVGMGFFNV
ncbi:phage integrase SAM-like domain-containing protein [uncultured Lutibacter sp.]|uniref:phage integrase SAM-like domain-containing protein n=1 Tax=uncultured Lutibacter sp. TaxID=437739 RepID=UPI0026114117|nr:phage integrase SAM-like domain-containing protein [uncultured Lutibacter sp.]